MSAPTLSMAAGVAAVSSSLYNNTKPSSLFSSSIHFLPSRLSSKQLKPSNLKTQSLNSLPLSLNLSLPRLPCFSAAFDSFQVNEDDQSSGEEYSETETQDLEEQRQQEEAEEDKVSESGGEEGKLYVGNLPYSMTSSELTEIFSEAGSVAKVEVCGFFFLIVYHSILGYPTLFSLFFFFSLANGFFLFNFV